MRRSVASMALGEAMAADKEAPLWMTTPQPSRCGFTKALSLFDEQCQCRRGQCCFL